MNLDPEKLIVLFVIAMLVLGPKRLPEAARTAGRWLAEIRKYTSGFQSEMRDMLAEPREQTRALHDEFRNVLAEPREHASALQNEFRSALDEPRAAIEAGAQDLRASASLETPAAPPPVLPPETPVAAPQGIPDDPALN